MNNRLTKKVFDVNPDHEVVMVEDKTWRSSAQTRMTVGRAWYLLKEAGVELGDKVYDEDEDEDEERDSDLKMSRVRAFLSNPITINGKTFYIPPRPETAGVSPQWNWRELNPGWFEATADGAVYAVGLHVYGVSEVESEIGAAEVRLHGTTWLGYWYAQTDAGSECRRLTHQPTCKQLVEMMAYIEDVHERAKDTASDVGG